MNGWVGAQRKKNSRKCHEIKTILTLILSKTSLENTKEMRIFSLPSIRKGGGVNCGVIYGDASC